MTDEKLKERALKRAQKLMGRSSTISFDKPSLADELELFASSILKEIRLELEVEKAAVASCIATIGGMVEGNPTGRHNFLQRLRELIKLERVATLQRVYLAQSPEDKTAAAVHRIIDLEQQLAEAQAQVDATSDLANWLEHKSDCKRKQMKDWIKTGQCDCSCGLVDALERAVETERKEKS